jgi:hypothetical protein
MITFAGMIIGFGAVASVCVLAYLWWTRGKKD